MKYYRVKQKRDNATEEVYLDWLQLAQNYLLKAREDAKIEGHKIFTDIHLLFADSEIIGYAPQGSLTEKSYVEKFDFIEYGGKTDTFVTLRPGMFVLFFPGEPHQPLIMDEKPKLIDKVIFKIAMKSEQ